MKSKDLKFKFRQSLAEALKGGDSEKVCEVFESYAEAVREEMQDEIALYQQTNDSNILAARGVHQLTGEERKFFEAFKNGIETGDIKQAFTGLENAYPETFINAVTEDIRTEFPLLDAIDFTVTPALVTKVLKNGSTAAVAKWGQLNSEITKELSGVLELIDITKCKLSAIMFLPKDMLEAGLEWLEAYARAILVEATGTALSASVLNDNGKNCPIGMNRDCSKTAAVVDGEYPMQTPIEITDLGVKTFCALLAMLAKTETGRARKVDNVIMVVNPTDYFLRILPNIAFQNAAGEWVFKVPFPIEFICEPTQEEGVATIGLGKNYNLTAGYGGKDGAIEHDDSYKFGEDLRTYITKIHANGMPKDALSFYMLDISKIPTAELNGDSDEDEGEENT